MLMSIDDKASNNLVIRNLTKQFNNLGKKVVIIDTLGIVDAKKYTAGVDFKLPLNKDSLAFMYQDCLNDATSESKSLIMEIFKDLAEYSETVPFVPFETLKAIVDDMVDNSHVFKLLVLKNKLAKFHRLGYFASNKNQIDRLGDILDSQCVILDLSKLDSAFQNKYLDFIYESLKAHTEIQVFLELSNVVSKKSIKNILSDEAVATTIVTHSKFKYLNDIKNIFDNFIVVPSFANNTIFNIYSTFLSSMPKDTYLLVGEATNYIPLVSLLTRIDETVEIAKPIVNEEPEIPEEENSQDKEFEEVLNNENPAALSSEIVEVDLEENEEEAPENIPSSEEILASIEEKSDDIISKAIGDTEATLPENMFEGEEETPEEDNADEAVEEISEADLEEDTPSSTPDEDIVEESYEEVPLSESFETEVHQIEEIEEYNPQELNAQDFEEIPITEELEPDSVLDELEQQSDDISVAEPQAEEETLEEIEVPADIDIEEPEIVETPLPDEINQPDEPIDSENGIDILPLTSDDEFDSIVELDPQDADENDIVIDMEEDEDEELSLDEQIVKDVDKVFTSRKDDEISDSDLDFIDELNSDAGDFLEEISDSDNTLEELAEADQDGILEEIPEESSTITPIDDNDSSEILETRSSSTPIVPVYNADIPQEDMVMSDNIQQGDVVTHAKYGSGVVEKMIKYGNKTLFSINFDNIGRRLLDPTLTEIKKA